MILILGRDLEFGEAWKFCILVAVPPTWSWYESRHPCLVSTRMHVMYRGIPFILAPLVARAPHFTTAHLPPKSW